jgi:catechol 2,3-dioxygenase-like lactoylglutathione lyase family enzyme
MTDPIDNHITHLATVAIPVADQHRALDFYVGTLGFEVRLDAPFGDGLRWIEVAPPGATTTIALAPPAIPDWEKSATATGIRLQSSDAEADHARLLSCGVDVHPDIMRWPGVPPMFTLRDPDGNGLVLIGTM